MRGGQNRPGPALRAWAGSFGTNVALLCIGIVTGIVTARILGPEGRGALAEVIFWGGIAAQLANLGLPSAVTIEAARTTAHARLIVTSAILASAYSLLAGGVFWALSGLLVSKALLVLVLAYVLLYLPANLIGQALLAVDRGRQRFGTYNVLQLIPQLTYLAGILAILALGTRTVGPFAWASLAGSALVALACAGMMRRAFRARPSAALARRLALSGAQLHLQPLIGIFQQSGDRLLILAFLDQGALGFYAVALTVAGAGLQKVSGATMTILLPKAAGARDDATRGRQLAQGLSATLIVALVLNGALALACPFLIPALFGASFAPAVPAAIILCLTQIVGSVLAILSVGLRAYGDWTSGPLATLVSLVVFVALGLALVPGFGITGVALGMFGGRLAGAAVILLRATRTTGLPLAAFLIPPGWLFSPAELRARLARPA